MPRALQDRTDDLQAALALLEARTPYAEALGQASDGLATRIDKEEVEVRPTTHMGGVMLRAWTTAGWREIAITPGGRQELLKSAVEFAESLPSTPPDHPPAGEPASGHSAAESKERIRIDDFSLEDRVAMARRMLDWASSVPGIHTAFARVQTFREERLFVSSTGCVRYQRLARCAAAVFAVALEGGRSESNFEVAGGTGGLEVIGILDEARIRKVAEEAVAQLKAKSPPEGKIPVVLDPGGTGTFAHESFGHGTEADQFLRDRSYLKPLLGQQVGPEMLTLVDDGSLENGFGTRFFDDEGFPTQRTTVIEHGRFVEVLHDRESAAEMHRHPTGNARRSDYLSRSFVRMTNTGVLPGEQSLEDLLSLAGDGVLLERCTSGVEDPLGGQMQIKFQRGRRIEHGQLTDVLPSMALSGRVLDFLHGIRGIGKVPGEITEGPGQCGKGSTDLLPVGSFGPYLLSEAVVGRG